MTYRKLITIAASYCIGLAVFIAATTLQADQSDRVAQENVPLGKVTKGVFSESKIFPGTTRDYSVYVPAQYQKNQPANLMVFMDGKTYLKPSGLFRVPIVFDNLIHKKEMPVTVAVFINPGTIKSTKPNAKNRSNRSFEYDSLGDRYSKFLLDEFLPVALEGLNISQDATNRSVCGISSGGICAFTVAWERPDQFSKVISHIGSFTNIRGGWAYPGLIRKTKEQPKPIKVYLQDGKNDLDNLHGNWPLGNQDLAAALQFAGYPYKLVMTAGGHNGKLAGEELPDALRWLWDENAEPTDIPSTQTTPTWKPHPDAIVDDKVPHGIITKMPAWESEIFPGTIRDWAVYVPQQYDKDKPTALMVFQDGQRLRKPDGKWNIPTILDNLIARGDMPPTIGIFIDPGHDKSKPRKGNKSSNRSFEYDSLGDRYVRFLAEEIIPEVAKTYNLSTDPKMRAIGGSSSGAICAFNAAWERPDLFQKVYSNVGSFTNIRGGDIFPSLVRKSEQKPLRVYMADTSGDLDNRFGSWPLANQRLAAALAYMGYDVRFDWAAGYKHGPDYATTKLPEAMKWLWRKEKHVPALDTSDDHRGDLTLLNLLINDQSWEIAVDNLGFADGLCSDDAGNLYFSDMRAPAIYRIDAVDGKQTEIVKESASGLEFGPNGLLYGCQGSKNQLISIDVKTGEVKVVAKGVKPNDLAVTKDGFVFITETKAQQVTRIELKTGQVTSVDKGINRPNGIALSNDGGTLAVSEYGGTYAWMFRTNADGTLDAKMPSMTLRRPIDDTGEFRFNEPPPYKESASGDGMAVDKRGRYYITSALGIQIFDPTGRPCGLLPKPDAAQPVTSCILAGQNHSTLFIAQRHKIYRRRLTVE